MDIELRSTVKVDELLDRLAVSISVDTWAKFLLIPGAFEVSPYPSTEECNNWHVHIELHDFVDILTDILKPI